MPEGTPWWLLGLLLGIAGPLLVRWYLQQARAEARQATRRILDQARQRDTKT
jgi:hypothetical protein